MAQFQDLELADLVSQGLCRHRHVPVGFALHFVLIYRGMVVKEVNHLLPRPVFIVEAGIHDQPDCAQHVVLQVPVIAVGILKESHLFAQALRVKSPTLGVGSVILVLAERRKLRQFLCDRDLHVVAGNALVIRGGFYVQRGALFEVAGVHHDMGRPRSILRPFHVVRGSLFLAELLDRHDFQFRFRKTPEHQGQLRIHLVNILLIEVDNLLAGMRVDFGICRERGAKTLQVLVAELIDDFQHACFDFLHLSETDLVNFFRRKLGGGALLHQESIARGAIRERP